MAGVRHIELVADIVLIDWVAEGTRADTKCAQARSVERLRDRNDVIGERLAEDRSRDEASLIEVVFNATVEVIDLVGFKFGVEDADRSARAGSRIGDGGRPRQ